MRKLVTVAVAAMAFMVSFCALAGDFNQLDGFKAELAYEVSDVPAPDNDLDKPDTFKARPAAEQERISSATPYITKLRRHFTTANAVSVDALGDQLIFEVGWRAKF